MSDHGLTITHRPDLPAIVARWHREVTPQEFQSGYNAVLAVADEHHCSRWLLDLRRRNDMDSAEIHQWICHTFMPQLTGRFERPVRLAFLASPSRAADLAPPPAPNFDPDANYQTAVFIDEAEAYHWLADGPL